MLELRQQLANLGLGLVQLGVFEELLRLLHLEQDQLLAREVQCQLQPRRVFRLQASQRLGEPEHPLLQLVHLSGDILLGEPDRIAIGRGLGLGLLVRLLLVRLLLVARLFVEDAGRFVLGHDALPPGSLRGQQSQRKKERE